MDAVLLARLQFALTIGFHFIFPAITIGLAWMLVVMEGLAWRTGELAWDRAGRFFGKLFGITFVVGVATGIVMEFQFGTNWASYSRFVGDVFGAPLAAEGVFAFFLESTFLGLYLFGRDKVSRGVHWFSILMVAVGATISAFWILVANSWQQTPAGFEIVNGRAVLTSFSEAVFNPSTLPRFFHSMDATLITGALFVSGVSALLVLRRQALDVATKTLGLGVFMGLVFSLMAVFLSGHIHASQVARTQPEKFAAIEGLYESRQGAPLVLFALPQTKPPELRGTIEIPGLLSWLAFGDPEAEVKGLNDFESGTTPQGAELWLSFVSFHNMVLLGLFFIGITALASFLAWRRRLAEPDHALSRWVLRGLVAAVPLAVLATEFGWIAAEVGRQPWVVYKVLRTADAASVTVTAGEILFSIIAFGLVYILLGAAWIWILWRKVKLGPEPRVAATSQEVA
jgi:cytochrome d ubiquinol oxidase subunit I